MMWIKKFGHTSTSLELSPTSTKTTTHSTCAPLSTQPFLAQHHLYPYMPTSSNQKGGLKVKKPRLSLASTIAFGGFIDKIRWDWTIDKAILSMEIKITNITYISNWPETFPHYNHTQQTITIPQNLTHEQHQLKHNGIITNPTKNDPSKKTPHPHHSNTLQKQWATKKNSVPLISWTMTTKLHLMNTRKNEKMGCTFLHVPYVYRLIENVSSFYTIFFVINNIHTFVHQGKCSYFCFGLFQLPFSFQCYLCFSFGLGWLCLFPVLILTLHWTLCVFTFI